jgi:hypothetical protein
MVAQAFSLGSVIHLPSVPERHSPKTSETLSGFGIEFRTHTQAGSLNYHVVAFQAEEITAGTIAKQIYAKLC